MLSKFLAAIDPARRGRHHRVGAIRDFRAAPCRAGLVALLSAAVASQLCGADPVQLHWLGDRPAAVDTGVSWGVPWPEGAVPRQQTFTLTTADGKSLSLQEWPLAYWPDGSLKWTGLATVIGSNEHGPFTLATGQATGETASVTVQQSAAAIVIDTGKLVCRINCKGQDLIGSLSVGGTEVARNGRLICVQQDAADSELDSAPKRTLFVGAIDQVTVEQSGPVRAVVRIDGRHRSTTFGHREWLPFTLRLYFYAGQDAIHGVHTITYDGAAQKDFIRALGISFDVPMREQTQNRHVRFSGTADGLWSEPIQPGGGNPAQQAGERLPNRPPADPHDINQVAIWSDYKLTQLSPDGFTIVKRTNPQSSWIFAGAGRRASGFAFVGDVSGGLGISVKDFWQSYPSELEVQNAAAPVATLTAWLWSPDASAMDLRHYDTRAHGLIASYEDVQPGLSTPYGVSRTSEFTLYPAKGLPSKAAMVKWAEAGTKRQLLVASPTYLHSTGVFGVWSLPDRSTPLKATVEARLDSLISYYEQQVEERYWYGFWYYGDFIHSYNRAAHQWYYDWGGHAWDNTELGAPLWLWYTFLRTGREDVFRLAEAHTRNTSETDVYHIGPMTGLGSRHNVIKWGDGAKEARISQAAHWRPFYYLTTDERTGDIMHLMALKSDVAAIHYDPMREAQPVLPQDPKYPGRLRIGPDWFALAGDWMTEWERTGDTRWRDKIVAGVDSILAMPYWIRSGVRNGLNPDLKHGGLGPLKGGGSMTVGYDPATGKLLPIPDPIEHQQVPVNYNLSTIQGGAEVMFELVPLLGRADWAKAWLQYCRLGDAPADVLTKDRTTGKEGGDARYVERGQGGPRLAAYAYAQTKDAAFAERAVQALARFGGPVGLNVIHSPDALNPVHEAPFVSTNDASQSSLTTIEILALCGDHLPDKLPPAPPRPWFRGGNRPRPQSPGGKASTPDNPASSRPASGPAND